MSRVSFEDVVEILRNDVNAPRSDAWHYAASEDRVVFTLEGVRVWSLSFDVIRELKRNDAAIAKFHKGPVLLRDPYFDQHGPEET